MLTLGSFEETEQVYRKVAFGFLTMRAAWSPLRLGAGHWSAI